MTHGWLLAEGSYRDQMGQGFRREGYETSPGEVLAVALYLVGAVLLVVLVDQAAKWRKRVLERPHPRGLFRDLCRLHRLRRSERLLLTRLAAQYTPDQPAAVFVWPEAYERGTQDAAFTPKQRRELTALWRRLGPQPEGTHPQGRQQGGVASNQPVAV